MNPYYYKPYERNNKFINKSNKNPNFPTNNHNSRHFHHSSRYMKYPHQRIHFNHNNNYLVREGEKEARKGKISSYNGETITEKHWKCSNWTKMPVKTNTHDEIQLPPKWCKDDALKAVELEQKFNQQQSNQYVLKFPDPYIDKSIIQGYSSAIIDVRVQQPITPRFVYIQLQPETDAEKLKQELSKIPFGNGFLKLEKRNVMSCDHLKPEDIDPFTIFIGNIHPSISVQSIKDSVKKAYRVDVGFAKKHKFGRYAFAKFRTALDAKQAFEAMRHVDNKETGMDLVVRFRRLRGNINLNEPKPSVSKNVSTDPLINQSEHIKGVINSDVASTTSIEDITTNLLTYNDLDWDKLPLFNSGSNNSSIMFASDSPDPSYVGEDLDDLINQLYSDDSSVFPLDDSLLNLQDKR